MLYTLKVHIQCTNIKYSDTFFVYEYRFLELQVQKYFLVLPPNLIQFDIQVNYVYTAFLFSHTQLMVFLIFTLGCTLCM